MLLNLRNNDPKYQPWLTVPDIIFEYTNVELFYCMFENIFWNERWKPHRDLPFCPERWVFFSYWCFYTVVPCIHHTPSNVHPVMSLWRLTCGLSHSCQLLEWLSVSLTKIEIVFHLIFSCPRDNILCNKNRYWTLNFNRTWYFLETDRINTCTYLFVIKVLNGNQHKADESFTNALDI